MKLTSMLVGQYEVLSLRSFFLNWWYLYILVYIVFISSSINIFFPLFNQRSMIKIVHDGNKVFNKRFIYLLLFILIEGLFVNQMHIFLNMQFWMVFATEDIALFFAMKKSVSGWSTTLFINLTSFRGICFALSPFQ